MDKRVIRDRLRLAGSILFFWLYIPHFICYFSCPGRKALDADLRRLTAKQHISMGTLTSLLYFLHTNRYFRSLFYYRIGATRALLISWIRRADPSFILSYRTTIGPGLLFAHPYATVLSAESIGENFSCVHLTTLGDVGGRRPVIGDNVTLGANVTIVGGVHIGDNVVIGAGSVVVKDIPSDSVAVGNPARVVKTRRPETSGCETK